MRIHVPQMKTDLAALDVLGWIDRYGGEWIVNAVEDEGFIMARMGTMDAERLERSGSDSLCGVFDSSSEPESVAADLLAGREAPKKPRRAMVRGTTERVIEALRLGEATSTELAKRIGIEENVVQTTMSRLEKKYVVRKTGKMRQNKRGAKPAHVYAVAA